MTNPLCWLMIVEGFAANACHHRYWILVGYPPQWAIGLRVTDAVWLGGRRLVSCRHVGSDGAVLRCRSTATRPRRGGFTLVELLVVIAIIGLLIALLLPPANAGSASTIVTFTRQPKLHQLSDYLCTPTPWKNCALNMKRTKTMTKRRRTM